MLSLSSNLPSEFVTPSLTLRHGLAVWKSAGSVNSPNTCLLPRIWSSLIILACKLGQIQPTGHEYRHITINGKSFIGLLDNQAQNNVMTIGFVKSNSIRFIPARIPFTLANKTVHHSCGYAVVTCATNPGEEPERHVFYVFTNAVHPLILGRKFVRHYYDNRNRQSHIRGGLKSNQEQPNTPGENESSTSDIQVLVPRQRELLFRINAAIDIIATLDCGADFDAISLTLAQRLGFRPENKMAPTFFRVANGRTIQSRGLFDVRLESTEDSDRKLLIKRAFTVVDNLVFDLVLGNPFIRDHIDAQSASLLWNSKTISCSLPQVVAVLVRKDSMDRPKNNHSWRRPISYIKHRLGQLARRRFGSHNQQHTNQSPGEQTTDPVLDEQRVQDTASRVHARHQQRRLPISPITGPPPEPEPATQAAPQLAESPQAPSARSSPRFVPQSDPPLEDNRTPLQMRRDAHANIPIRIKPISLDAYHNMSARPGSMARQVDTPVSDEEELARLRVEPK